MREVYRFGEFRLDLAARRLTRREEPVALPPKAFELLLMLVRNADRAVTRTELLDTVWRDTIVEEGNLGWNMSVLRKALDDGDGRIIETVRGFGYRFVLPVERDTATRIAARAPEAPPAPARAPEAPPAPAPAEPAPLHAAAAVAAPGAAPAAAGPLASPSAPGAARRRVLLALLAAVALAALAVVTLRDRAVAPIPDAAAPGDLRPALAVLPFENLSAKAENVWLATALAEMLNGELAIEGRARTTPGESVAHVTSVLGNRAGSGLAPETLSRLRQELGVELVVVGNYLLLDKGEGLRVDYRLQAARDGSTLFAASESGSLSGLLGLVARAGGALRSQLPQASGAKAAATAGAATRFNAPTGALRAYSEGIDLRRRFQLGEARREFERAIAEAPDFALAHAALADLLAELGYVLDARAASQRAIAGGDTLAPAEKLAIEAKNRELEGRWAEAAALWRDLVNVDPAPIENQLSLARALSHAGSHDAARAKLAELSRRPPPAGNDPRIELERGWVERYAQDFAAMRAAGERALVRGRQLDSGYVQAEALALIAWADLSWGSAEAGLESCSAGQKIAERIGHNRLRTLHTSLCAWLEANLGRGEEAVRDFRRSEELAATDGNVIYQAGAVVALGWQSASGGKLAEAGELAARALALASSVGDRERELNSLELVSHVAYLQADLDRAEVATVEALAKSRDLNIASRIALHLGALGRIRLERGDVAAALAAHEEAVRILPVLSPGRISARDLDLARTRLANGDAAGTIEICDRIERRLKEPAPQSGTRLAALALRGRAELLRGHRDAAEGALAELAGSEASATTSPDAVPMLLDIAELLAALNLSERAEKLWREILDGESCRELELARRLAALRLAELASAREPGAANATRLDSARAAARTAKLGRSIGEKL